MFDESLSMAYRVFVCSCLPAGQAQEFQSVGLCPCLWGVPKDEKKAVELFKRSAELGNVNAKEVLEKMNM